MPDVTVVILDRPRHAWLVQEARATGARIKLITDGDVAAAIAAADPTSAADLLIGIGGAGSGAGGRGDPLSGGRAAVPDRAPLRGGPLAPGGAGDRSGADLHAG